MSSVQRMQPSGAIPTEAKDAVAFWNNMAGQFARGQVACQVMCGFSLIELRDEAGIKRGGDHTSKSKPDVFGFASWEDFIEETYDISDDTGRKWMDMAKGVRTDFKKLGLGERFRALLVTPPSQWSEDDTKLLSDSLAKCTDGMTQTDFLQKLGLAKKKSGNPNASGKGSRRLTLAEQAEAELAYVKELMGDVALKLEALQGRFTCASDLEVEAFDGALSQTSSACKAWLRQPQNNRNQKAIDSLFTSKV